MRAARLVLLVLLGGCGVSRSPAVDRSAEILTATAPRSVHCVVESYPRQLPGVETVVDSARLAAALRELGGTDPAVDGYVLLTLGFGTDGVNVRREVIEHTTRPLVADSVQRLVFAARRQVAEVEEEWGVRLRIDLADPPTLRIGRREFCPPTARDPQLRAAMEEYSPPTVTFRGGRRTRVIHMRVRVSELGVVTSAHAVRGELPGSSLEQELVRYLRQFLFTPATLDGYPTGAWVEIPVRVRA